MMACFESSVGVIVHRGHLALLIQRAKGPQRGTWAFPAGHWEPGESAEQTAVREVAEEVALTIEPVTLTGPWKFDRVRDQCRHGTPLHDWIVFEALVPEGQFPLRDPDETLGMRWVPVDDLAAMDLEPVWRHMLTETGHIR